MSHIIDTTKSVVTTAPKVAEGVVSGFVIMALPLLLMGLAATLAIKLVSWPMRAFNAPSSGGSE